jgi:phosphoribosyl-ATP pyrophosphohydrolase
MTLDELYKIVEERKKNMSDNSYSASLFRDGADRIMQKVGEESVEVVIAAKNKNKKRIISEVSDLWFHTVVLLSYFKINPKEVFEELERRKK